MTRCLALDIGDRRIGVALSDSGGILASPLTIIERSETQQDIDAITGIISQHQVERIVVGLPRMMDGTIGRQAEKVGSFAQSLSEQTRVPIIFRDERLTTVSARRLMKDASTKKTKKPARDDAVAAALILQGYLDESPDTA
ncbi:MAG: Holliday junction resolvase RuvX [Dehalococcoidales bacterium]|nr:Holliday junction resolvase RuvX [Dehalococcoidales bacterium]